LFDGARKAQPSMETTSFTANPEMLSGVKFVKVVPAVTWTVRLKGDKVGGALAVVEGGTK
jgi:hypothetical protein